MGAIPQRARVVVIGGGIIGTSVAYHLAELGERDVVLLERDRLTSGTTWHAAGLMVTFGSTSETSTAFRTYSRDLYQRVAAETGQETGFKPVGFIELATDSDRLEEYRRVAAFNRHCGVDVHEISAREVEQLFPMARVDDVLAGFYVPGDGRINPVDVTMALAKAARARGVRIVEGVPATGVIRRGGRVAGVRTEQGDIEAEFVVNCGGMWARQLGEQAGVSIPLQAAEHYYLITDSVPGLGSDWPVIEDPRNFTYIREEVGGLMIGLFETVCAPWNVGRIPDGFSFGEIPPDFDRMAPYVEAAMSRVPISAEVGVRKFFCGPESFTPDLAPIVGEAPELPGYFVAAGLNSIGILTGGGLGRAVAQWVLDGVPDVDVTAMNIDRLHPYQATPEYRATRTVESLGMVYQTHFPYRSMQSARRAKLSPLHQRLVEQGAYFRDVSGWEGADWYAGPGATPTEPQLTWGRPGFWRAWADEHHAIRTGVGLIDMSFMAKFEVSGEEAGAVLEHLSANRMDGRAGRITYTQWLNRKGLLEADLTVTKLDEESFWIVASDTAHRHVLTMLRRAARGRAVSVSDLTGAYAQINIQGPRSRELLAAVTHADMSHEAFAFRDARWIDIGFARALCTRITYVGELGYELFIPAEQAVVAYDRLVAAGRDVGLRHVGLKALGSLRMEKGYRDYGHDIDNTDDPIEAGLDFAVAWDKPDFVGREALIAKRDRGPVTRRLAQVLLLDPDAYLHHAEVVLRDGTPVGYVRAGSYGHTLGGAVGLAMLDVAGLDAAGLDAAGLDAAGLDAAGLDDSAAASRWEVDVAGRRVPARVSLAPLYDPSSSRIRG